MLYVALGGLKVINIKRDLVVSIAQTVDVKAKTRNS